MFSRGQATECLTISGAKKVRCEMYRPRNQHTIAQPCELRGRGYWTGQEVTVSFHPASPYTGIRFMRSDLFGRPVVPANVVFRHDVDYRTVLRQGTAEVAMIEHVMAALYGLEIDNCTVCITGCEVPGWDGSAKQVTETLRDAGLVMQAAQRQRLVVDRKIRVSGTDCWIEAAPTQHGRLSVEYQLDYGDDSPIQAQTYACVVSSNTFIRDVAPARTFVTAEQVSQLRAMGVGKHVQPEELLVFDRQGLVSGELHWSNECARHKALDLIGDLALAGYEIIGKVTSYRGGHRLNADMAQTLVTQLCQTQLCRKAA